MRQRIDVDDEDWMLLFCSALDRLVTAGELPDDELLRDIVLAQGELLALVQHNAGHGDAQMLAAFDSLATSDAEARAAALERVKAVASSGCFDRE